MPETVTSPGVGSLSARPPSQRILNNQKRQTPDSIYPGLNDMGDALEALPLEIIKHFTLLREIDAKCISTAPKITQLIIEFLKLPLSVSEDDNNNNNDSNNSENQALAEIREALLSQIRVYIRELMPCLEEKMHVAGIAAESIQRHISRIDYDFDLITDGGEIPDLVRIGPLNHPAIIADAKLPDNKSVHSQRSESRREAIKAKKAAAAAANNNNNPNNNNPNSNSNNAPTSGVSLNGVDNNTPGSSAGVGSRGGSGRAGTPSGGKNTSGKNANTSASNNTQNNSDGSNKRVGNKGSSSANSSVNTNNPSGSATAAKRRKVAESVEGGNNNTTNSLPSSSSSTAASRPRKPVDTNISEYDNIDASTTTTTKPSATTLSTLGQVGLGANHNSSGYTATDATKAIITSGSGAAGAVGSYDEDIDAEPVYCYCQQVSFGEMVGCDGPNCKREWFHLPCIGLAAPPKGQWFCEECATSVAARPGRKK